MNPELIHDALTLLPNDLITAVDKLRSHPRKPRVHWARWVSLAACLALILCAGFLFRSLLQPKGTVEISMAVPAQDAPAAAAPIAPQEVEEEVAAEEAPASDTNTATAGSASGKADHRHDFATEPQTADTPVEGYCGNTQTIVYIGDTVYSLSGSDSIAITDILINLDYMPEKRCRCTAEYTVDTETLPGIEINLTEGFARCEKGQADLTAEQTQAIREIINTLG